MEEQTQEQIDVLVQEINEAEDPRSVTNAMVGEVLQFLMTKIKEIGNLNIDSRITQIANSIASLLSTMTSALESLPGTYTKLGADGRLLKSQVPVMVLASMGRGYDPSGLIYEPADGDTYLIGTSLIYKDGSTFLDMGKPSEDLLYCNAANDTLYRWNGSQFVAVSSPGGNAGQITNINDGQHYRIWVGTQEDLDALNGVFEDDVIYLVGTIPEAVTKFNVITSGLTHCTVPTGTPTKVTENDSFTVVVSPESGYTIDSCQAAMGSSTINGVPLTGANAGKYQITINAVTANISISASASVHLQSIVVSAGTQSGNVIPMSAALTPANAENVSLQWSVSGSQYVSINSSTGALTILEGASSASVTVTCTDANSGVSGTLQLTGLTYNDVISSLTAVGATRTGTNTVTLNADGRTSGVNFSLQGTVPTVKYVRRWEANDVVDGEAKTEAGHDLVEVPAVTLNGNTLIYKGDCTVAVKATAANDSSIYCEDNIVIAHDNSDQIWFEDVETLKAVNGYTTPIGSATGSVLARVDGSSYDGCVTYEQAAAVTSLKLGGASPNTKIIRFDEFQWFTNSQLWYLGTTDGSVSCRFDGCSSLEHIIIPSTITKFGSGLANTAITDIVIPSTVTVVTLDPSIGGVFNNTELETVEVYATITSSSTVICTSGCSGVKKIVLSDSFKTTGALTSLTGLEEIVFGTPYSEIPARMLRGCTNIKTMTLRYAEGVVTYSNGSGASDTFGNASTKQTLFGGMTLKVPATLLQSYKDDQDYWNYVPDNNISAISTDNSGNTQEGGQS